MRKAVWIFDAKSCKQTTTSGLGVTTTLVNNDNDARQKMRLQLYSSTTLAPSGAG